MTLAYEGNTSLAFNTTSMRQYGAEYANSASELRNLASQLDDCLKELSESGWTTPAGSAFQKMVQTNWEENIERYADLLDTLKNILDQAANKYDGLTIDYIEKTKI